MLYLIAIVSNVEIEEYYPCRYCNAMLDVVTESSAWCDCHLREGVDEHVCARGVNTDEIHN